MAPPKLSDALCKQALRLYKKYDGHLNNSAKAAGVKHSTFHQRLDSARERFPDLAKQLKPKPKTITEHAVEHQQKLDVSASQGKLKDALREINRLQERLSQYEWGSNASLRPAEWASTKRSPKKQEHMPYLLTSDAQLGEVVDPKQTETGYGYNQHIYVARHRYMIDTVINLSFNHAGPNWTYPGIVYARGGDTLSGGIHDELKETDDLTPIQACKLAFETESAGIIKLAEAFGRVDIKTPGAAGNHDRDTMKPRAKNAAGHSYDALIAYMLGKHFANDKRIHFQTSESFDVFFPIYAENILLTHGDRMGSGGGQGFIGPMATIMRGAQKVFMEQAALGRHVHRVDHGHYHSPGYVGWVLSNGSYVGVSEYSKSFRMRPNPPIQMFGFHHPRHGLVDLKPINLLGADR